MRELRLCLTCDALVHKRRRAALPSTTVRMARTAHARALSGPLPNVRRSSAQPTARRGHEDDRAGAALAEIGSFW